MCTDGHKVTSLLNGRPACTLWSGSSYLQPRGGDSLPAEPLQRADRGRATVGAVHVSLNVAVSRQR